jgi:hypothetical protein
MIKRMLGTEAMLCLLCCGAKINNFNFLCEVLQRANIPPQYNFKNAVIRNERKYLNLKFRKNVSNEYIAIHHSGDKDAAIDEKRILIRVCYFQFDEASVLV